MTEMLPAPLSIVGTPDHADNVALLLGDKEFGRQAIMDSLHGHRPINVGVAILLIGFQNLHQCVCVFRPKVTDLHCHALSLI
jgi:hypothetical protein